jgi:hypothetical protein
MSFDKKQFSPVHVNAGPYAPRIFSYCNMEDLLSEILEPGYFNEKKMIMRPNSFLKVVCKDAIVELVVDTNISNVTMKDEFLRATDPYKEQMKSVRQRRTKDQIKVDEEKAKLAKTG